MLKIACFSTLNSAAWDLCNLKVVDEIILSCEHQRSMGLCQNSSEFLLSRGIDVKPSRT